MTILRNHCWFIRVSLCVTLLACIFFQASGVRAENHSERYLQELFAGVKFNKSSSAIEQFGNIGRVAWTRIKLNQQQIKELVQVLLKDEDFRYFYPGNLKKWKRRLSTFSKTDAFPSPEELSCLSYYEVESGYRTSAYEALNIWLRTGKTLEFTGEELKAMALLLASTLNKMPTTQLINNKTVFRGLSLPARLVAGRYIPGTIITEPAFTSSSLNRAIADDFSYGNIDNERVIFEIHSRTGKLISGFLSKHKPSEDSELEVIFFPKTMFRVVSSTFSANRRIIKLEELPTNR